MTVADGLLFVLACIVLVPFAVLAIETCASLLPVRRSRLPSANKPAPAVVLIPAHNEEGGIAETLNNLIHHLDREDRVLVVADNCTDATAVKARQCGVEVIERSDATQRGKGFALDFGIQHLESNPPEIVVVVDADCRLRPGALQNLKAEALRTGDPVQAVYILAETPGGDSERRRLSRFAFLFKNAVRPLGLHRLGAPCLLTGTGMAFPWNVIRHVDLASGNIVEDMKLGIDLAVQGHCPRLCPQAIVEGDGAPHDNAAVAQRTRWEHGHVRTLLTQVPRLYCQAVLQCRPRLVALALELGVPPLSLLLLAWTTLTGISAAWWGWGEGSPLPVAMLSCGAVALALAIFLAWLGHGRSVLPLRALLSAPLYVLWKFPIYVRLVRRPERAWVRTDRHASCVLNGTSSGGAEAPT